MSRTSGLIIAAIAAGLAAVTAGAVALAASTGPSLNPAAARGYPGGIGNPKLVACLHAKNAKKVCNPDAWKQLTSLPVARPPAPDARIPTSASVIAEIRSLSHAAPVAPAASALMTGAQFEHRFGESRNSYIDETRLVWVVTVKTPMRTDGGPARPGKLFDHVSVVVDAQTGTITDVCVGCAWLPVGES